MIYHLHPASMMSSFHTPPPLVGHKIYVNDYQPMTVDKPALFAKTNSHDQKIAR
jgi:hypothetical protein